MAAGTEASGECGICYEAYRGAGGARAPQLLSCHHSLCQSCLRKLVCRAAAVAFVSCPFCRMVTLVPELALGGCGAAPALGTPRGAQLLPREEEEEEGSSAPAGAHQALGRSVAVEVACAAHAPVFAVSSMVSPCGFRRSPEAPGAFVLGLPGRGLLLDPQPPLASMEPAPWLRRRHPCPHRCHFLPACLPQVGLEGERGLLSGTTAPAGVPPRLQAARTDPGGSGASGSAPSCALDPSETGRERTEDGLSFPQDPAQLSGGCSALSCGQ